MGLKAEEEEDDDDDEGGSDSVTYFLCFFIRLAGSFARSVYPFG